MAGSTTVHDIREMVVGQSDTPQWALGAFWDFQLPQDLVDPGRAARELTGPGGRIAA
jgi:hypothetical protein